MKDVLRTSELIQKYKDRVAELGGKLLDFDLTLLPHIKEWGHWVMVKNEFPYDKIASEHDLVVPIRRFEDEEDMNEDERYELTQIKIEIGDNYDSFLEGTDHNRTLPKQFHMHCIKYHAFTPIKDLS